VLVLKATHIIFMVTWFAGLFYLPRLFVYHAMSDDATSLERFKVMERKLFYGIMTPGGLITLITGIWLWFGWGIVGAWIHIKVALVFVLVIYHVWCGVILVQFKNDTNKKSHVWFRWFNEFPVVILVAIVFLVVLKP